jgi:hypothetical protein
VDGIKSKGFLFSSKTPHMCGVFLFPQFVTSFGEKGFDVNPGIAENARTYSLNYLDYNPIFS